MTGVETPNRGYVWYNDESSFLDTIVGGSAILFFVGVWILSVFSPILLTFSIKNENHIATLVITLLTLCAYVPWSKGIVSKKVTEYSRTSVYYFKKCSIIFQTPSALPKNEETPDRKPLFYAYHPHGAFCFGWSMLFCSHLMENVRFCFSSMLLMSPFFRLLCRLTGKPGGGDKNSMVKYMSRGENVALPPGGFEEATLTSNLQERVFINNRFGFIKLALKYGYDVVPIYTFGETYTYWNFQGHWNLRLRLNSWGIPGIAIWGAKALPILPKRHTVGLMVVVGDPIVLPKIDDPSKEDVKIWHTKYVESLVKLYNDHKCEAYGKEVGKGANLEVW